MLKAVLIDLDGTLADTAPQLHAAACAALRDAGMPEVSFDEARTYIGDGMPRFIKRLLTRQRRAEPPPQLFAETSARLMHHYDECCVESRLYDGAAETLGALAEGGFALACVTNKAARYTEKVLAACGITAYFQAIVCGDTLAVKKPSPLPLLYALEKISAAAGGRAGAGGAALSPAEAVMVGDSPADSNAAAAAGCGFICARYGYHPDNQPPAAAVNIDTFADLLPALGVPAAA